MISRLVAKTPILRYFSAAASRYEPAHLEATWPLPSEAEAKMSPPERHCRGGLP